MADPFTPKFVDLVRNYTTTTGTGNFALGPVANGYAGFTAALNVGDSFYYSAIGVDKPAEREVGRGTLLAGGIISRDPISGAKTNFTAGIKAIALVAAAEWFATTQAAGTTYLQASKNLSDVASVSVARTNLGLASAALEAVARFPVTVADRAALAAYSATSTAYLREPGREGLFVWDSANHSAHVTADAPSGSVGQGIYVAPAADATGASGAWVRKFSGPINAKWFGAKGDGATDDAAAIAAAIAYINSLGGGTLYFPAATYKVASSNAICRKLTITGDGPKASIITSAVAGSGTLGTGVRSGSVFYSNEAINGSTAVNFVLKNVGLTNTNAANIGAGYYDQCGTFLQFRNVVINGFKYGIVFDQTELADIDSCDFEGQNAAGAWLVNGTDLNASASSGFTNRISISRCQFNEAASVYGILDDGGGLHTFADNNYNGCLNHIRAAGVSGLDICGGEFESAASHCITLSAATLAGGGVGSCLGRISGGVYAATGTNGCINFVSGGMIEIGGGVVFSTPGYGTGASVRGCVNVYSIKPGAISVSYANDPVFDNYSTVHGAAPTLQAAAPATGYHRQGEVVLNRAPIADALMGWRCVASGTPGTWETLYAWTDGDKGDILVNSDGTMVAQSAASGFAVTGALTTVTGNNNFDLTGGYTVTYTIGTSGAVRMGNGGDGLTPDLNIRPEGTNKGVVSFTHNGVADRWSIGLKASDANLYFASDRTLGSVKMTLSSSALNLAAGVALQNNGTPITNGSGVLQAASFPALTGDVTTSAGALATAIAANTVSYAKFQTVAANSLIGNPTGSLANAQGITLGGGLAFSGTTLTAAGALTPTNVASTGAITSSSATAGVGYTTGAGGAVTQATSKSTGVTLGKVCGQITMNGAALAAAASVSFTVTNTQVAATDTINLVLASGNATAGTYNYQVDKVSAGSFVIWIKNISAGSLSEALLFNFSVKKAVSA